MLKAISNTSPLLYLYRIGGIDWLPKLEAIPFQDGRQGE